jgi:predicted metalloprotease with PDZ domain
MLAEPCSSACSGDEIVQNLRVINLHLHRPTSTTLWGLGLELKTTSAKHTNGHATTQVTVGSMTPASPAALAGLVPGDHVVAINGHAVTNCNHESANKVFSQA